MKQVSFTQLMTYVRCPEHYLFKYVLHFPRMPRKALKHGFALHETLGYHFEQKKADGKGITSAEAKEFFVDAFRNALEEYELELEETKSQLTREYLAKEKEIKVGDLIDFGLRGIDAYFAELNPRIKPDLVEAPFTFEVAKGIEAVGRIDLTDTKGVIHELKTTRTSPAKQDVRADLQIALYQIAYKKLRGSLPKGISKDYIVLRKNDSKVVRFQESRSTVDQNSLFRSICMVAEAARRNIFYCLHPAESWECSKAWCGYYKAHQELKKLGLERFIAKHSKHHE